MEKILGLSERLRAERDRANLTQAQVARQLGIKREQIAKYEAASTTPTLPHALALAEIYGVSVDYLLGHPAQKHLPTKGGENVDRVEQDRRDPPDRLQQLERQVRRLRDELARTQTTVGAMVDVLAEHGIFQDQKRWMAALAKHRQRVEQARDREADV